MDWRHIEVVTELPFEFVVGGGLVGLVTMIEAVADTPPNVAARIAQLLWSRPTGRSAGPRTSSRSSIRQAKAILAIGRAEPSRSQVYLGEEDEMEGWTA